MSVIESYAYGKPVIGADIGGIPEIVEHNKTGYLFESGNIDALAEQIEIADNLSDMEYEVMSKNAWKFAEIHFNPENYIIELIKIYNKIIYG
jgi:glycosyltransferase involved in cell wall biosynthesis